MKLCSELQQSHEMDYQNGTHFVMNFMHDIWQHVLCTETKWRWMFVSNRYKVNFVVQRRYATWQVQIEKETRFAESFYYSRFHITFPRRVAKFVGKLGTRFWSSQLHGELDNQTANFESKFPTSAAPNFVTLHRSRDDMIRYRKFKWDV